MAAALECWSSHSGGDTLDDDLVDQVLMRTHDRSESLITSPPETKTMDIEGSTPIFDQSSSAMQKRFQHLSCNFSGAIASIKNSLNLDSAHDNNNQNSGGGGGGPSPRADAGGGSRFRVLFP